MTPADPRLHPWLAAQVAQAPERVFGVRILLRPGEAAPVTPGLQLGQRVGDIQLAALPGADLIVLLASESVVYVEGSTPLRLDSGR